MKIALRYLYLKDRLFYALGGLCFLFLLAFALPWLLYVAQAVAMLLVLLVVIDGSWVLLNRQSVHASRQMAEVLSLHDANTITLELRNLHSRELRLRIIDELPFQLQERNHQLELTLPGNGHYSARYTVRPFQRGAYTFHNINIYVSGIIGFMEARQSVPAQHTVKVYPSVLQMKRFALHTLQRISFFQGVKKMRRIGHSYEFEQIKQYVSGDDIRSINWKATGRTGTLMVNHFEDEKAQQVYCIIDKSRNMKMPFQQLTLMDYAINASLVIANTAIRKQDKAGLITFSDKIDAMLAADRHAGHMRRILETLYNEQERFTEASFDQLFLAVRKVVKVRSLMFLFTNFESQYALERLIPVLRKLNKLHLLVVVFFLNDEVRQYGETTPSNTEEIFLTTMARKFSMDKEYIAQQLTQYGIQSICTTPEELTINTLNKYLELKSKGMI